MILSGYSPRLLSDGCFVLLSLIVGGAAYWMLGLGYVQLPFGVRLIASLLHRSRSSKLRNSADMCDAALAKLPPEIRAQMEQYLAMVRSAQDSFATPNTQIGVAPHAVIVQAGLLMGAVPNEEY